ncbi:hypothetical protein [Nocardia sp. NPDC052566]|uniref:hypothetical protein n=1 Tax=Nocardia sp. NPDC052566 TaxID=3364330 RepID=UPI0037CB40E7
MTITIGPETGTIIGWAVTDYCGGREEFAVDERALAVQRLVQVRDHGELLDGSTGDEFWAHQVHVVSVAEGGEGPVVNITAGNAARVLKPLGIELFDADGYPQPDQLGATEFRTRLVAAVHREGTAGYVGGLLTELIAIADWAIEHDRAIVWS